MRDCHVQKPQGTAEFSSKHNPEVMKIRSEAQTPNVLPLTGDHAKIFAAAPTRIRSRVSSVPLTCPCLSIGPCTCLCIVCTNAPASVMPSSKQLSLESELKLARSQGMASTLTRLVPLETVGQRRKMRERTVDVFPVGRFSWSLGPIEYASDRTRPRSIAPTYTDKKRMLKRSRASCH